MTEPTWEQVEWIRRHGIWPPGKPMGLVTYAKSWLRLHEENERLREALLKAFLVCDEFSPDTDDSQRMLEEVDERLHEMMEAALDGKDKGGA